MTKRLGTKMLETYQDTQQKYMFHHGDSLSNILQSGFLLCEKSFFDPMAIVLTLTGKVLSLTGKVPGTCIYKLNLICGAAATLPMISCPLPLAHIVHKIHKYTHTQIHNHKYADTRLQIQRYTIINTKIQLLRAAT